jgi:hypothetical protein
MPYPNLIASVLFIIDKTLKVDINAFTVKCSLDEKETPQPTAFSYPLNPVTRFALKRLQAAISHTNATRL